MQSAQDHGGFGDLPSWKRSQNFILILLIAIVLAYMINLDPTSRMNTFPAGMDAISQTILEEKYGLRVSLVAVTAAGGFVDVRLLILDGEKAKSLLENPNHFPSLAVEDVTLHISQRTREQEVDYETNSTLFFMFTNAGNTVHKGTPVTIQFGNIALEPIKAQ